jgi:hypothetical protein
MEAKMKFYPKQIPVIAKEIVKELLANEDIEVEPGLVSAAQEDFSAIMREYQRQLDDISGDAKTLMIRRGWPSSKFAEAKRIVSANRKLPTGDDGLDYVINQMLEFMMMSNNLEEVYAPDNVLRKRIVTIIRRHLNVDEEIDNQVRARLRNVQEGTPDWEIQYRQISEQVRRNKGLV